MLSQEIVSGTYFYTQNKRRYENDIYSNVFNQHIIVMHNKKPHISLKTHIQQHIKRNSH